MPRPNDMSQVSCPDSRLVMNPIISPSPGVAPLPVTAKLKDPALLAAAFQAPAAQQHVAFDRQRRQAQQLFA